jgi:condensin complex subunit 2
VCRSFNDAQQATDNTKSAGRSAALAAHQIADLLQNCLQLAAENKITTKNAWDLQLIDHLPNLVTGDCPPLVPVP